MDIEDAYRAMPRHLQGGVDFTEGDPAVDDEDLIQDAFLNMLERPTRVTERVVRRRVKCAKLDYLKHRKVERKYRRDLSEQQHLDMHDLGEDLDYLDRNGG